MTERPESPAAPTAEPLDTRRVIAVAVGVVVVLVLLGAFLTTLPFFDDLAGSGSGSYVAVTALVLGDAIIPVLPGETTLNTAATLAAQGSLDLWAVVLAGGLGAVLGDSCVYWIARGFRGRWHDNLMDAAHHPKATVFLDVFADKAPLMIVFGRYVPGVRLVVNVTMGAVVRLPYPTFLRWSVLAGFLWSAYTCVLAYAVASVLSSRPLASILISGFITTAALVAIGWILRRGMARAEQQPAP